MSNDKESEAMKAISSEKAQKAIKKAGGLGKMFGVSEDKIKRYGPKIPSGKRFDHLRD